MSLIYRSIRPASRLRPAAAAGMAIASSAVRAKHTLPDLPYDYAALEPAISGKIMELHHSKHHQTYVNSLNDAEGKYATALHNKDLQQQINLLPLLKFHGGGHINHTLFWQNLAPPKSGGGAPPTGPLADEINLTWGNYEEFKKIFNASLAGIQGSGWSWLVKDNDTKALQIISLPNQDPVVGKYTPLLGIDAWEHAYYLDYQNRKAEYFSAIWNVINWRAAEQRFKP